ncbi:Hypothetical predicted protein, partial [Paramuricea clavata]
VGPGANTLSSTTNDETLGNCTESNATVSLPTVSTTDDNKSPITAATKSTSLPATEVEAPTSAIVDKEVTGAAGATATEIAGTGAEASGTDQLAHPTTEQLEPLKDTWKENPHRSPRCNGCALSSKTKWRLRQTKRLWKKYPYQVPRQYPILYDPFSKDFKDKGKKDNAWSKVAEATGLSIEECTRKYKNIRTNYVRNCKKRKPSGSGRASEDSEDSNSYRWLDTFIENRKTFTNLPSCLSSSSLLPVGTISDTESSSISEFSNLENDSSFVQTDVEHEEEDDDSFGNVSNISVSPSPEITSSSLGQVRKMSKNNRPWAKG